MKMTRRDFAAGAFAAAGVTFAGCGERNESRPSRVVVGEPYPAWMAGHFQIHMIYTGVAESQFLIFPDGTSLLIDCGDHPACRRANRLTPCAFSICMPFSVISRTRGRVPGPKRCLRPSDRGIPNGLPPVTFLRSMTWTRTFRF